MASCEVMVVVAMLVSLWVVGGLGLQAHSPSFSTLSRPDPNDSHRMARWLVASNSWAVVSTISIHLKGAPWGNVVDFSDGTTTNSTGVPYFYLTMLDPTPQDLVADSKCSVTISEAPLGTCGDFDVEDPRCAKLTLYGEMKLLHANALDFPFGKQALFSKHPQMKDWPTEHKFNVYKLLIEDIFLVDYFGGPKQLSVVEYFKDV